MDKLKTLYLHIGFPKTGSTAIQTALAKSESHLNKFGVSYAAFPLEAKKDKITSGNGVELVRLVSPSRRPEKFDENSFEKTFVEKYFKTYEVAIISSELLGNLNLQEINSLKDFMGRNKIKVIPVGCVRNLYDHTYSLYMQSVKRHGDNRTFSEFHRGFYSPQIKAIRDWGAVFDNLQLISYDKVKENLVSEFIKLIHISGIEAGLDVEIHGKKINRSLTIDETLVLAYLNKLHGGVFSQRISDALLYNYPDKNYVFPVDSIALADMIKKYSEVLDELNTKYNLNGALKILDLADLSNYERSHDISSVPEDYLDIFKVLTQLCLDQRQEIQRLKDLRQKA